MEQGHRGERHLHPVADAGPQPVLLGIDQQVAVRQLDPLGDAGGAAGIEQDRGVLALHADGAGRPLAEHVPEPQVSRAQPELGQLALLGQGIEGPEQRREVLLDAGDHHVPQAGLAPHAVNQGEKAIEDDGHGGAAVLELVLGFAGRVERVEGDDDGPGADGRQVGDDELRAVGQVEGHPVARLHAEPLQRGGEAVDVPLQAAVGNGVGEEPAGGGQGEDQRRPLGYFRRPSEREGRPLQAAVGNG